MIYVYIHRSSLEQNRKRARTEGERDRVYTSDSHENTVGRLSESLPEELALLLPLGEGDFGGSPAAIPCDIKTHTKH